MMQCLLCKSNLPNSSVLESIISDNSLKNYNININCLSCKFYYSIDKSSKKITFLSFQKIENEKITEIFINFWLNELIISFREDGVELIESKNIKINATKKIRNLFFSDYFNQYGLNYKELITIINNYIILD